MSRADNGSFFLLQVLGWLNRQALGPAVFILCLVIAASAASAEVYLTKEQALDLVFGKECEQHYLPKEIPDDLMARLRSFASAGEEGETAHFFSCTKAGRVTGYALIDNEIGKHLPITYIVGISPNGKVTRVEIMVFREVRGWEARERRFMAQFEGKGEGDPLQVGKGIVNVTGATLSAKAVATGVRRALILWHHFFGGTR